MKKVILTLAVAAVAVSFSSCSKSYTCTYEDGTVTEYNDYGKVEAEAAESACKLSGGTWEKA